MASIAPNTVSDCSHTARWRWWRVEFIGRRGMRAQVLVLESAHWPHPHVTGQPDRADRSVSRARCPRRCRRSATSIAPNIVSEHSHTARWRVEFIDRRGMRAQGVILESAHWHHPHVTGQLDRAADHVSHARCPRRVHRCMSSIAPYCVRSLSHGARWWWWRVEFIGRRGMRAQVLVLESAYWHHPHVTGQPDRADRSVSRARLTVPRLPIRRIDRPHVLSDCSHTSRGGGGGVWTSVTTVAYVCRSLHSNHLTGTIPTSLGSLIALQGL